jgi:hypothetical protein
MYVISRQGPDYKFVFYMFFSGMHEAKEKNATSSLNELSLKIHGINITHAIPQIVSRFVAMIQAKLDEIAVLN